MMKSDISYFLIRSLSVSALYEVQSVADPFAIRLAGNAGDETDQRKICLVIPEPDGGFPMAPGRCKIA